MRFTKCGKVRVKFRERIARRGFSDRRRIKSVTPFTLKSAKTERCRVTLSEELARVGKIAGRGKDVKSTDEIPRIGHRAADRSGKRYEGGKAGWEEGVGEL